MKHFLVVRHKIGNYESWKRVFNESEDRRREAGLLGGCICRNSEDVTDLIVTLKFSDIGRAREFLRSDYFREAMRRAGVLGEPSVWFLDEVATVPELAAVSSESGEDFEYSD